MRQAGDTVPRPAPKAKPRPRSRGGNFPLPKSAAPMRSSVPYKPNSPYRPFAGPMNGSEVPGTPPKSYRDYNWNGAVHVHPKAVMTSTGGKKMGPDPKPKALSLKPDNAPAGSPTQLARQRRQLVYRAIQRNKAGKGGAGTAARLKSAGVLLNAPKRAPKPQAFRKAY